MRKVKLRDEAKTAAAAAGPCNKTPAPAPTDPKTDARLLEIEKAIKALASAKGVTGKFPSPDVEDDTNFTSRKRRQTL